MSRVHVIPTVVDPKTEAEAKQALRTLIPGWRHAQAAADTLEKMVLAEGRKLARARGMAFIRPEMLEAEFGGSTP